MHEKRIETIAIKDFNKLVKEVAEISDTLQWFKKYVEGLPQQCTVTKLTKRIQVFESH